ncbi:hypothetical protein BJX64DRAFT_272822 [Aspergillus heterothallicus]
MLGLLVCGASDKISRYITEKHGGRDKTTIPSAYPCYWCVPYTNRPVLVRMDSILPQGLDPPDQWDGVHRRGHGY